MTLLLSVAGEAMLVVVTFALQYLLMLLFRNPLQPNWLKGDGPAISAALIIAAIFSVSFGLLISGLIGTGMYFPYAFGISVIYMLIVSIALWRILNMRARLDACDQGRSPFRLSRHVPGGAVGQA